MAHLFLAHRATMPARATEVNPPRAAIAENPIQLTCDALSTGRPRLAEQIAEHACEIRLPQWPVATAQKWAEHDRDHEGIPRC